MSEQPAAPIPVAGDCVVLARRYVGVLLELAEKDGSVDAIVSDMSLLRQAWYESAELRSIASDPRWGVERVAKSIAELVRIFKVSALTANFLFVTAQNLRLGLLPIMIEKFREMLDARNGEFVADVSVARPLSDAQKAALAASLGTAIGGTVRLSVVEDASILGGITVKLGSQFIDASVKTRLDRLECTLKGAA